MAVLFPTAAQRADIAQHLSHMPDPSIDVDAPAKLIASCPRSGRTPLVSAPELAASAEVGHVWVKDERERMGLGSFKALGAAYVIAQDAAHGSAAGQTYVTASAGNHGLSVAAGAAAFGARSVIYISETVPEGFAERLRLEGAEVRREGAIYEDSMEAAAEAARADGLILLSDSSWEGYTTRPHRLMEGYLLIMQEVGEQMPAAPSHIFLQAGVGGLAAACAAYARVLWGNTPKIVVVEPDVAPALINSVKAGAPTLTEGPASDMGRLDCKEPSLIALKGLARDADAFITISEEEGHGGADAVAKAGLASTPSGAAGAAGLLAAHRNGLDLGLTPSSDVLLILSEAAT